MFETFVLISFQVYLKFSPFSSAGESLFAVVLLNVQLRRQKGKSCQQYGKPALGSLDKALTEPLFFFLLLE